MASAVDFSMSPPELLRERNASIVCMGRSDDTLRALLVLASFAVATSVGAQSGTGAQIETTPSRYPSALPKRQGPAPPLLAFRIVESLRLPGKLTGESPAFEEGRVRIPLQEGSAVYEPTAPSMPLQPRPSSWDAVPAASAPAGASRWVDSPDGKRRFRALPDGAITAEKRCRRCASGWKREWTAHLPGVAVSEPLIVGHQLFVGALDTRVHCLRVENGHRVWSVDVGDRVTRPVVRWNGMVPGETPGVELPVSLLLVVGQGGGTLIGLDPYDGRRIATLELQPSEGRLATAALVGGGGSILVGRETYASPDGDLLVLAVDRAPIPEPTEKADRYGKVSDSRAGH